MLRTAPLLRTALLAGLAAAALTVPAAAGSQFTYVSQSIITLKGLPARKKKRIVTPAPVVQRATLDNGRTMSAEERRLLRYGVAEDSRNVAANAAREVDEEDAADTMTEAPEDIAEENVTVAPGASAADAEKKPTVTWKSASSEEPDQEALEISRAKQADAEAPKAPERMAALDRKRQEELRRREDEVDQSPDAEPNEEEQAEKDGDESLGVEARIVRPGAEG